MSEQWLIGEMRFPVPSGIMEVRLISDNPKGFWTAEDLETLAKVLKITRKRFNKKDKVKP